MSMRGSLSSSLYVATLREINTQYYNICRQLSEAQLQPQRLRHKSRSAGGGGSNRLFGSQHEHHGWSEGCTTASVWSEVLTTTGRWSSYRAHDGRCADIRFRQTERRSSSRQADGHSHYWTWSHTYGKSRNSFFALTRSGLIYRRNRSTMFFGGNFMQMDVWMKSVLLVTQSVHCWRSISTGDQQDEFYMLIALTLSLTTLFHGKLNFFIRSETGCGTAIIYQQTLINYKRRHCNLNRSVVVFYL